MVPLMILNIFGGIASGIWLAILGEWGGIGAGLLASIGGAFFCSLLLIPGMIVTFPAIFLMDKGGIFKVLGFLFGMVGLIWTYVVMSGWGIFSFNYFVNRSDASSYIPYLIWAYGVAIGPWAYMASKEANGFSAVSVFFLQIASITTMSILAFSSMGGATIVLTFLGIMAVGYVLNLIAGGVMAILEARER
jgi:hypothetical protein